MIERQVYNALSTLCNGQVYPLIADEKVEAPFIVYTTVSATKKDTLCGSAETKNTIQVDAYHEVYDDLLVLIELIITKLEKLPIFNINTTQSFESETRLYRAMIEISLIN